MFPHRLARVLGAATLCASLAAFGQPALGTSSPTAPSSGGQGTFTPVTDDGTSRVVPLGDGDRVRLEALDGGRQVIHPLPGADGTRPGLLLATDGPTTTIRSTENEAAPTVLNGDGRPPGGGPALQAASGADSTPAVDLVELRFESVGRDGRPANGHVSVFDVETGAVVLGRQLPGDADAPCTAESFDPAPCVLVPPGTYSVMAFVNTNPAGDPSTERQRTVDSISLVGDPELSVDESMTYTLDARLAEPLEVSTPGHRASVPPGGAMELGYTRIAANGRAMTRQMMPVALLDETFYSQPTGVVSVGQLSTLTRLRLEAPDIEFQVPGSAVTPEYYDKVWFSDVASDFPMFEGKARLRVVDAGQARDADLEGVRLQGALALIERSDALSVAEQSNAAAAAGASLVAIYNDGPGESDEPGGTGTMLQVPTVRLSQEEGRILADLPGPGQIGVRGEPASPYLYDLVIKEDEGIPADLSYVYRTSDLATQTRLFAGQPSVESTFSEASYEFQPGESMAISTIFPLRGGPRERVEYRIPDPDTRWNYLASTPETVYNALFPDQPVLRMQLSAPVLSTYPSVARTQVPMGVAPITSAPSVARPLQRQGDVLRVSIDGFVDAENNRGGAYTSDSGMQTLLQVRADGEVVGETAYLPSGTVALPAGESLVQVSFTTDNPQDWAELSTHTQTSWTFPSTTAAGQPVVLPVILPDYDVALDAQNRHRARGDRVEFDLGLSHVPGADQGLLEEVTVEASYDDGATWQQGQVTVSGDVRHVVLPRDTGLVSLRLHVADENGSVLDQTIIRAFAVL